MTDFLPEQTPATVISAELTNEMNMAVALAGLHQSTADIEVMKRPAQRALMDNIAAVRSLTDFSVDAVFPATKQHDSRPGSVTGMTREEIIFRSYAERRSRASRPAGRVVRQAIEDYVLFRTIAQAVQ